MEITACPNCGSKKIYQGRMGDGVLTGYTNRNVCRDCGYQGTPIIFDSEEDYKKFLEEKQKEGKTTKNSQEKIEKVTKNESPVKKNRPIGVTILIVIMILNALLSTYFYYDFVGFENTSWLWIYYIIVFIISALVLPYGFLKAKSWAWTIAGFLFALSIPIGLFFLYYLTRPHVKKYFGKE